MQKQKKKALAMSLLTGVISSLVAWAVMRPKSTKPKTSNPSEEENPVLGV